MTEGSIIDISKTSMAEVRANNIRYRIWHEIYIFFKTCTNDMQVKSSILKYFVVF